VSKRPALRASGWTGRAGEAAATSGRTRARASTRARVADAGGAAGTR
jgi:hypothetical protein